MKSQSYTRFPPSEYLNYMFSGDAIVKNVEVTNIYIAVVIVNGAMANVFLEVSF